MRLFFALMPGVRDGDAAAAAAAELALGMTARRVPRGNYHVTLAFLGEVDDARLPAVETIGAARRVAPFALRFDAYEYWPKPEVVVCAARLVPAGLEQLWRELHGALASEGLALDAKRLRPHITVARKVSQAPVLQAMSGFEWSLREFALLRSDTGGAHSIYTVVATWPLLYDAEETWKNSAF